METAAPHRLEWFPAIEMVSSFVIKIAVCSRQTLIFFFVIFELHVNPPRTSSYGCRQIRTPKVPTRKKVRCKYIYIYPPLPQTSEAVSRGPTLPPCTSDVWPRAGVGGRCTPLHLRPPPGERLPRDKGGG